MHRLMIINNVKSYIVQNARKADIKEACPVEDLDSRMHLRKDAAKGQSAFNSNCIC